MRVRPCWRGAGRDASACRLVGGSQPPACRYGRSSRPFVNPPPPWPLAPELLCNLGLRRAEGLPPRPHPGRRVSLAFSRPRTARSTPASTSRPSIRSNLSQPVEKVRQPPVHARTGSASVTVAFASVCWEGASGRPDPYRSSDISFSPSNPITAPAIRSIQSFDRKYPCRGCSAEKATATSAYQAVSTAKIEQTSSNPDNHVWPVGRSAAKMLAYTTAVFGLLSCVARPRKNDLTTEAGL
jgi:hypothetical protein